MEILDHEETENISGGWGLTKSKNDYLFEGLGGVVKKKVFGKDKYFIDFYGENIEITKKERNVLVKAQFGDNPLTDEEEKLLDEIFNKFMLLS